MANQIDISKDVDQYKEGVFMGFTVRECAFALVGLICGSLIVLFLNLYFGLDLTLAVYCAVPVSAPIFLCGFYNKNGMYFDELMKVKRNNSKIPKELVYQSTDDVYVLDAFKVEKNEIDDGGLTEQEKMKKQLIKMGIIGAVVFVALIVLVIVVKFM